MATTSVTISATCLNGKPLEALERLIAQRQREMGETTSEAVIATAINALTSIRAATKVVDVKKASGFVNVAPYPALVPSVMTLKVASGKGKGKKKGEGKDEDILRVPCLRYGPKGHHADVKFHNLAPKGTPLKGYKCFIVQDRRGDSVNANARRYYVIALSEEQARAHAAAFRAKRIERFKGMAKWTLGQAQSQVSQKGVAAEPVTAAAKQIGLKELQVAVYEHGWGKGSVTVSVADTLRDAALALKGGPAEIDNALMRAANRTAGIINAHYKMLHPFDSESAIPTPFPEIAHRKH